MASDWASSKDKQNGTCLGACCHVECALFFERPDLCDVPKVSKPKSPRPNVLKLRPAEKSCIPEPVDGTWPKARVPNAAAIFAADPRWIRRTFIASRKTCRSVTGADHFQPQTSTLTWIYASYKRRRLPQTPQTDGYSRQRLPDAPLETLSLRLRCR